MKTVTPTAPREEWRQIPDLSSYEVSSLGRLRSHQPRWLRPRLLKPSTANGGYLQQVFNRDGKRVSMLVHRVVAAAFLGPCPEGQEVRHIDGDPTNNCLDNLAYGTKSENIRDQLRHGTHSEVRKTHCRNGHPYTDANTYRDPNGHRDCRTCRRATKARHIAAQAVSA